MKKESETVWKIENQYVSDDCIQVMIPYKDAITVLDQNGILFHSKIGSNVYMNKYLEDERKERFPYSKIPTHYSKNGLKKYAYTNQLFEFEKPYISVGDGVISENFAIKDNDQALLISKILDGNKTTKHMTYDELLDFVKKSDPNEQVYYVYLNGAMPSNDILYPSKEEIYAYIQGLLMKNVENLKKYQKSYPDIRVSQYLESNPRFLKYIEESIKKLDLSLIDFNVGIGNDPTLLVVRVNNDNINIQGVDAVFVREDDFKVDICDIPVTKFVLEQLKSASKLRTYREPQIPLRLNPGIEKQDVREAKEMVKTLRRR